jgi:hypothetical protein
MQEVCKNCYYYKNGKCTKYHSIMNPDFKGCVKWKRKLFN